MKIAYICCDSATLIPDGQVIFDNQVSRELSKFSDLKVFRLKSNDVFSIIGKMLLDVQLPIFYRYQNSSNIDTIRAAEMWADILIFSHEALSIPYLMAEVKKTSLIIFHNYVSAIQGNARWASRLKAQTEIIEDKIFQRDSCIVNVLSYREASLIFERTGKQVEVITPGFSNYFLNPPTSTSFDEIICGGSAGWYLKKRDFRRFKSDLARVKLKQALVSEDSFADDGSIRLAIITDRFLAGCKLKVIDYMSRHACILSYVDVGLDLPAEIRPRKTIRLISDLSDVSDAVNQFLNDIDDVKLEISNLKNEISLSYSWHKAAERIFHQLLRHV